MRKLDNHGETLIEIIIATVILAICSLMLASGFASASKIANKATLYKMESSTISSSIELEEKQDSSNTTYSVTNFGYKEATSGLTLTYVKNGQTKTTTVKGRYVTGTANNSSGDAKLTYSEFLSNNFSFTVPAEDTN